MRRKYAKKSMGIGGLILCESYQTEHRSESTSIEAHAPLKELFGYSNAIRSLSQGRASYSMEPLEYAAAPPEIMKEYDI